MSRNFFKRVRIQLVTVCGKLRKVISLRRAEKRNLLIIGAGASRGAREPSPPDGNQLLSVLAGTVDRLRKAEPRSALNYDEVFASRGWSCIYFSEGEIELVGQFLSKAMATQKGYEAAIAEVLANDAEAGKGLLLLLNRLIAFTFCFNERGMGPLVEGFRPGADRYDQLVDHLDLDASWMVISLNYDLLFEQALRRKAVPYYYSELKIDAEANRSGVPIFKIHGSVNWFPCPTHTISGHNPTPDQVRRATTRMTWDEANRRYSIDFPDVFSSAYRLIYQELVREEELLRSPIMAHYGPRKPVDVNFPFIDGVRKSCLKHLSMVDRAVIVGVRPVTGEDDPALLRIFEMLNGKDVIYVNPSGADCTSVSSSFGFTCVQQSFSEWLAP
jgi:hypothetical protein